MTKTDNWAASWLAGVLQKRNKNYVVTQLSSTHLRIARRNLCDVVVCATAMPKFGAEELESLLVIEPRADFYVSATQETVLQQGAALLAQSKKVAIGFVSDLELALELDDVSSYLNRTTHYIEQGMKQHRRILSFERIGNLFYKITTRNFIAQTVVFFNEYELTADLVRRARTEHGFFDLGVNTHIAGQATEQALQVADDIGTEILTWSEFFKFIK